MSRATNIGPAIPLLLLVSAIVSVPLVNNAATETDKQGPRIRFDETTHDFGEMRSDQKLGYGWVFHNDGDMPLKIQHTRTSCGCTASVIDESEVPPGGEGILQVSLDAAGLQGSVRKTLTVTSNDPVNTAIRLTIRAKVKSVEMARGSEGHPITSGQSLLMGQCATCHSKPAEGKSGEELYVAICAMCHGSSGEGERGRGPSLLVPEYFSSRSDEELATGIAYGTANPRMPGFSTLMGGPLSKAQIQSLVELLRSWGPLPGRADEEKTNAQH